MPSCVKAGHLHLNGFGFRNEMKETERAALGNKAKKCPVDTFLARGRVPPKQMAVQRTVSCFGEMVRVDDIGLDYQFVPMGTNCKEATSF